MKSRRKFPIVPAVILQLLVILLVASLAEAVHISQVKIYQMDFYGKYNQYGYYYGGITNSNWGDLAVTVCADSDPCDYYLNMAIKKGSYGPYWVITNMPLPNSTELYGKGPVTLRRFFSLACVGVQTGTPISTIDYFINPQKQQQPPPTPTPPPGSCVPKDVNDGRYNPFGITDGNDPNTLHEPNSVGPPPMPDTNSPPEPNKPREKKPYEEYPDVDEPQGGCGPGSVERGLRKMADANQIHVADMNSVVKKFKQISGWSEFNGESLERMLLAKAGIATDCGIYTKFQTVKGPPTKSLAQGDGVIYYRGGPPTFDFIKQEHDANEIIEILTMGENCGHAMTLVNCDDSGGDKTITIKDDAEQGKDGENEVRVTRFKTDKNGNTTLPDLPIKNLIAVISESPLPSPEEPQEQEGGGGGSGGGSGNPKVSVKWNSPPMADKPSITVVRTTVTLRKGWKIQWWWTMNGKPHPFYGTFEKTNDSGQNIDIEIYKPDDPTITDWKGKKSDKTGSVIPITKSDVEVANVMKKSPWNYYPLRDLSYQPYRMPELISPVDDVNIYTAVNLGLYTSENPMGFLGGAWEPNSTLNQLGVVIENGQAQDVNGIYWATSPLVFDANSPRGWVPEEPNSWLDSNDFQAQHGDIVIMQNNCSYDISDIDQDFNVDNADLGYFADDWLVTDCNFPDWCNWSDLDHSGNVDMRDFSLMAEDWLKQW